MDLTKETQQDLNKSSALSLNPPFLALREIWLSLEKVASLKVLCQLASCCCCQKMITSPSQKVFSLEAHAVWLCLRISQGQTPYESLPLVSLVAGSDVSPTRLS